MNTKKILFVLSVLVFCSSCRVRYIEVPIEKIQTEYKTQHTSDTIRLTDSVKVYQRADTVYVEKIRLKYQIKTQIDTIIQRDTITNTKIIEIPTQRRTKGYLFAFVGTFLALLIGYTTYRILRLIRHK
uniref:Uncharacterized protein n=1 Tax=Siphoviridae sp. ctTfn5 TaxID=2827878 RepID=A0A8S5THZ8_9CAUD|nr:MAG TPA: hypothetical protein [Siphoviridae sp. ctTfn5]